MKSISLLASSFSGSTVLSMALGSREDIWAFGDTYYSPKHPSHPCSCGKLFRECPFRQAMNEAMAERGFPDFWGSARPLPNDRLQPDSRYLALKRYLPRGVGALNRGFSRLMFSSACKRQFVAIQDAFFDSLESQTGCTYYFDGCKSLLRAQLMSDCYPETKVLHLVRDPRGQIASFFKRSLAKGVNPPGKTVDTARLRRWVKYNTIAAGYEQELGPERYLRIQYADLLSDPQATLRRVVDFFGPTGEATQLGVFDRQRLHVSGNRTNRVSKRIETRVLGDWRKFQDRIDFEYIKEQTRNLPFVEFEADPV